MLGDEPAEIKHGQVEQAFQDQVQDVEDAAQELDMGCNVEKKYKPFLAM